MLVHGAWHGSWCWERVVDGLTAAGVSAVAVDLPGPDLHADIAHVRGALDRVDGPVVLLGHSYGGAVITEAAHHAAVEHLVYLCAFALAEGETCVSAVPAAGISYEGRPSLFEGAVVADGAISLDPATASSCLYNRCDDATATWAVARLRPQPEAVFQQPTESPAWRTKPSTYVVCSDDLAVHPERQRIMAARCSSSVEWDADHSPFLSQPDSVVRLLAELAQGER